MEKTCSIYVAGHRGLVGSAIVRSLEANGYLNIVTRTSSELDLRDYKAVEEFFQGHSIDYVFFGCGEGRRNRCEQ